MTNFKIQGGLRPPLLTLMCITVLSDATERFKLLVLENMY